MSPNKRGSEHEEDEAEGSKLKCCQVDVLCYSTNTGHTEPKYLPNSNESSKGIRSVSQTDPLSVVAYRASPSDLFLSSITALLM